MKNENLAQRCTGKVVMAICIPLLFLITINHLSIIMQKIPLAVLTLLTVIAFDTVAIWAYSMSKDKVTKGILVMYCVAMGVLFFVDLFGIAKNDFGNWMLYLIALGYFFIFGFQINRAKHSNTP